MLYERIPVGGRFKPAAGRFWTQTKKASAEGFEKTISSYVSTTTGIRLFDKYNRVQGRRRRRKQKQHKA